MSHYPQPWLELSGRICVVTGAGGGIGQALVKAFASLGAHVVMLDRDSEVSRNSVKAISEAGGRALAVTCDVSDPENVRNAARQVQSDIGPCDILVNNAALLRAGRLQDIAIIDWQQLIAINLNGYFHCSQAFGAQMIEKGKGSIVHVGSISGSQPQAFSGAYSITKAGVAMLSRQLAFEWGPSGVRSNVVSPGLVRTPLSEPFYNHAETKARREAIVPARRIATPDDIADVAVFLASDRAGYVTGQEIVVDGGLSQTLMSHVPRPGFD